MSHHRVSKSQKGKGKGASRAHSTAGESSSGTASADYSNNYQQQQTAWPTTEYYNQESYSGTGYANQNYDYGAAAPSSQQYGAGYLDQNYGYGAAAASSSQQYGAGYDTQGNAYGDSAGPSTALPGFPNMVQSPERATAPTPTQWKHGPWTAEEDRILRRLAARNVGGKTASIGGHVPGRTQDACVARHRKLRLKWTEEEDTYINSLGSDVQESWEVIATRLTPGRLPEEAQVRWDHLSDIELLKESRAWEL